MDLQIEGRQIGVRPEWRADIGCRVADLHPGHDMTHARVTLTRRDHRKAEDSYDVLIVVHIPGHTLTARKQQNSFEGAIRDAFAALKVELEKIREKRASHNVRISAPPERGIVSKVFQDEGYGFITLENGTGVYFHRNAVHERPFEEIEEGLEVTLDVEPGEKGLQATTVNPLTLVAQLYGNKVPTT